MDRGFYSASNLATRHHAQIGFIIPLSRSVKLFSTLLFKNRRRLSDLNNSFVFGEEVIFHVEDRVEINQSVFQVHLYFNADFHRAKSLNVSL
jgi:hypothetical protein